MDITLLGLPQTQDRLADVRSEGRIIVSKETLEPSDRLRLSALATLLKSSDFDRIVGSARTALNEDANFYGVSESMRNVEKALNSYISTNEALQVMLEQIATADEAAGQPVSPEVFEVAVNAKKQRPWKSLSSLLQPEALPSWQICFVKLAPI
jgi:hypothetical protein